MTREQLKIMEKENIAFKEGIEYQKNKQDDYAIEFGKFVLRKYDGKLTTKELLEIFKKEKGL